MNRLKTINQQLYYPLKENFSLENFGAVSIWVKDYLSIIKKIMT